MPVLVPTQLSWTILLRHKGVKPSPAAREESSRRGFICFYISFSLLAIIEGSNIEVWRGGYLISPETAMTVSYRQETLLWLKVLSTFRQLYQEVVFHMLSQNTPPFNFTRVYMSFEVTQNRSNTESKCNPLNSEDIIN